MKAEDIIKLAAKYPDLAGLADEIAELCDADKYDALQVQDATWHDIEDKHLAALATAQVQAAVMAEALAYIAKFKPSEAHRKQMGKISQEIFDAICDKAKDALSAAPKVVWSANALVIGWDGAFKELLIEKGDLTFITGTEELDKYVGQQAQVIVLDKQGEGE